MTTLDRESASLSKSYGQTTALQAGLILSGTVFTFEPKSLGGDDYIIEEFNIPVLRVGQPRLNPARVSLAAMQCQKSGGCNFSDVVARSLENKITIVLARTDANTENDLVRQPPVIGAIAREGIGRIDLLYGLASLDVCSRHGALVVNALPFLAFPPRPQRATGFARRRWRRRRVTGTSAHSRR
jgi:hypothetical protein